MKDYYNILGVDPHCPQADIKKAYRQLALQHHPDKNQGNKKSEEHFKLIAEAYVVLNDVAARNEYDYKKGYISRYKGRGSVSGKPSAIQYLLQIKAVKNRVLTNGGHVKHDELYTIICSLLSDDNILHLLAEHDVATNNLIIDEVLTCCVFLDKARKDNVYERLSRLAVHYSGFKAKVSALDNHVPEQIQLPQSKTEETKPVVAGILIFGLLLLFIVLFWIRH